MRINIELNTCNDDDLIALKSMIDTLAGDKVLVDRGTGPLKEFDEREVTIWSSDEHGEMAKQSINLDKSVGDVVLNTIPKSNAKVHAEAADEVVIGCGNSLSLEDNATGCVTLEGKAVVTDEEQEAARKDAAKKLAAAKRKEKRDAAKKAAEAVVDVETDDASVKDASIDEALAKLDPEPPADKPVDHAAELRKLMVDVVKAHGPKGAKTASTVVNEIAGVKDVTKIPADKFEAVKKGLLAAIGAKDAEPTTPVLKDSVQEPDEAPPNLNEEANPSADDVDF